MMFETYAFIFGWPLLSALPAIVALVRRRPRLALGIIALAPAIVLGVPFLLTLTIPPSSPSYRERAMVFLMEPYISLPFAALAAILTFGLPKRAIAQPVR